MSLNEDLLAEDPESFAIEADDDAFYSPYPSDDDSVVVTEPDIITIGRGRRKIALRKEREEMSKLHDQST